MEWLTERGEKRKKINVESNKGDEKKFKEEMEREEKNIRYTQEVRKKKKISWTQ